MAQAQYKATRELAFTPIDGYPFELLRASVEPYKSPPVTVTALMEFNEARNTASITAKFSVRKKFNVRLEPITDLTFKFPVPSSWSGLFLADTKFGGKRAVQSTSALRGSFRRKIRSSSAFIQVNLLTTHHLTLCSLGPIHHTPFNSLFTGEPSHHTPFNSLFTGEPSHHTPFNSLFTGEPSHHTSFNSLFTGEPSHHTSFNSLFTGEPSHHTSFNSLFTGEPSLCAGVHGLS